MIRALKWFGIAFLALNVLVAGVGLFLDNTWHVSTSVVIAAPASAIHPHVDDLRAWNDWAFWDDSDPSVKIRYEGPTRGPGATVIWNGNSSRGRFIVTESAEATGVKFDEMIESDSVNGRGSVTYTPVEGGTKVTWRDSADAPPIIGGYFVPMVEEALTKYFHQALLNLKRRVETSSTATADAP